VATNGLPSFRRRVYRSILGIALIGVTLRTLYLIYGYFYSNAVIRRHHVESSLLILSALWLLRFVDLPAANERAWTVAARFNSRFFLLALAAAFLLFWPTLSLGFFSDDYVLADWARRGEFVGTAHEFVRPVPLLLWRLLFELGGNSVSVHVVNVLLHGINTGLTVHLSWRLSSDRVLSLIAGFLFLSWPTQVETVVWGASVSDLLMTSFVLSAVLMYLRFAPRFTPFRTAALVAVAAAAMLTKETAIVLPLLLVVLAATQWLHVRPTRRELWAVGAISASCAAYLIWRVLIRPNIAGAIRPTVTGYLLKEQLARTFGNLAVPLTTDTIADSPWLAMIFGLPGLVLVAWSVIGADRRQRGHEHAFGGALWCVFATAPAIGYLFVSDHLEGSRYLYLAMTGWVILLTASWQGVMARQYWMRPVGGVGLVLLGVLAIKQSGDLIATWQAAAAQRDTLLLKARAAARIERCSVVQFTNLPATYKGAQLFRNGFDEAFRSLRTEQHNGRACEFRWDGNEFRLQARSESVPVSASMARRVPSESCRS
jgi:hypothetical protein